MDENNTTPTPEELKEEQEALAETQDEKLRSHFVSSLGLEDNDANREILDKLVADKKESHTKLSKAIGQKIKLRDALKGGKAVPPAPSGDKPLDAETIRKQTEEAVTARLEQRDLEEMDYPDEIKAQIRHVAQVQGISVRKAEKDGYIQHLVREAVAAGKIDEATVSRTPRTTPAGKTGEGKMPTFDMSTEDGRKAFDQWKKDNGK